MDTLETKFTLSLRNVFNLIGGNFTNHISLKSLDWIKFYVLCLSVGGSNCLFNTSKNAVERSKYRTSRSWRGSVSMYFFYGTDLHKYDDDPDHVFSLFIVVGSLTTATGFNWLGQNL